MKLFWHRSALILRLRFHIIILSSISQKVFHC